jgi:ABC-2 type transport system permease protein
MNRILQVARREFVATVMTKGFIIGAFAIPVTSVAVIPLIVWLALSAKPPEIEGTLAVVDPTGAVVDPLTTYFSPDVALERARAEARRAMEIQGEITGAMFGVNQSQGQADAVVEMMLKPPRIAVEPLAPGADVEREKNELLGPSGDRIGVAVIAPDALRKPADQPEFGAYELYIRTGQDDRIVNGLRDGLRESILQARFDANDVDRARIEALTRVNAPRTQEVTEQGERASTVGLRQMLPFAFMILLMLSVMIGGQYLMTTTIEEKSSRVVEVLLSAVSPMQLMTGKVIGQLLVGLTLLVIYSGLGTGILGVFSLGDLLHPLDLVYLFVFFLLAYFMFGSLMAAVGAAVNDVREAQALMMPVILLIIIPYFLWFPISRDPNSLFSTVLSFLPPVSPFVIMMRIASTSPPPVWQILLAIGVNVVGAYFCLRITAKVFRVGLLMFGKPPNFRTLVRWVRMA